MTTKQLQKQLSDTLKSWQKIEDAAVTSTGRIIEKTDNPFIRQIMEIIQADSQLHRRVQAFVVRTLEEAPVSLSPDEMCEVWDGIEKHVAMEKKMVDHVEKALTSVKGKKMLLPEYFLNYLLVDEQKHEVLLDALNKIKAGMYPYAS